MTMRTIYVNDDNGRPAPCVATIGFFDGVHRGHRYLIDHVVAEAQASGLESVVITFDRHPRQVLRSDYIPQLLSTLDSKLLLLSETAIDVCAVLRFDMELSRLSARDFMEQVLRDRLNVRKLVIGYDNRFGHDRSEDFDDYARYGRELGIEVILNPAFTPGGIHISSSVIRSLIQQGDVETGNRYLGYPYTIVGRVVKGFQEGRKLGFPTANLDTSASGQLIPAPGVYAVKVRIKPDTALRNGMMNIGRRPTFGGHKITLEVNIFHFEGDLYGRWLQVAFLHRIREEKNFNDTRALAHQLKLDQQEIERQFEKEKKDEEDNR